MLFDETITWTESTALPKVGSTVKKEERYCLITQVKILGLSEFQHPHQGENYDVQVSYMTPIEGLVHAPDHGYFFFDEEEKVWKEHIPFEEKARRIKEEALRKRASETTS